jgi:hypothetical protein
MAARASHASFDRSAARKARRADAHFISLNIDRLRLRDVHRAVPRAAYLRRAPRQNHRVKIIGSNLPHTPKSSCFKFASNNRAVEFVTLK